MDGAACLRQHHKICRSFISKRVELFQELQEHTQVILVYFNESIRDRFCSYRTNLHTDVKERRTLVKQCNPEDERGVPLIQGKSGVPSVARRAKDGGPGQTRTADLTIISRAL